MFLRMLISLFTWGLRSESQTKLVEKTTVGFGETSETWVIDWSATIGDSEEDYELETGAVPIDANSAEEAEKKVRQILEKRYPGWDISFWNIYKESEYFA